MSRVGETFVTGKNASCWFLQSKSIARPTCAWGVTPSQIKSDFDASRVQMKTALVEKTQRTSQHVIRWRVVGTDECCNCVEKTSEIPIAVTNVHSICRIRCCVPRAQLTSVGHSTSVMLRQFRPSQTSILLFGFRIRKA